MLKHAYRLILSSWMILWAVMAQADVRIVITDGVDTAKPIAVVPFAWNGSGKAPQDIAQIIASDLRNSGKFSPIAERNMPQLPQTASAVTPKAWSNIGIDAVVVGAVNTLADGRYQVNYQLVDTVNNPGAILSQNQFTVDKRWLRYAAHTASDEVFQSITGIKGAFRTRIAYVVKTNKRPYGFELRVADYDGYDQITIHRSDEPLMSPAWSPDGKQIAFVTFEGGRSALKLKTLASGKLETLAAYPQHNGAPAFSPDGKKLAFALSKDGSLNLYVMDMASRSIRKITANRSNDTEPVWMPDNQTLIYTSDQSGRPQLYSININGGNAQRITWEGKQNQNPSVAPNGEFMVMITSNENGQNVTRYDFASRNYQTLTSTFLDETPSISPNGTMIIYSSTQGLGSILNLVSSDGRFKAKLPATDGQVRSPAWSPEL